MLLIWVSSWFIEIPGSTGCLVFYQLSWTSMYQAWSCGLPVELVSDVVYRFGLYQFYGWLLCHWLTLLHQFVLIQFAFQGLQFKFSTDSVHLSYNWRSSFKIGFYFSSTMLLISSIRNDFTVLAIFRMSFSLRVTTVGVTLFLKLTFF